MNKQTCPIARRRESSVLALIGAACGSDDDSSWSGRLELPVPDGRRGELDRPW